MTATPTRSTAAVWRPGDPVGDRRFAAIGDLALERGGVLPDVTVAYETWGTLSPSGDNAVLVEHALTGDSHVVGDAGPGHASPGWWPGLIGPGAPLDTDHLFVVASNVLGGCQGTHRAGLRRPRRASVGRPVPVHHHPRPGRRRGRRSPTRSASGAGTACSAARWAACGCSSGWRATPTGSSAPWCSPRRPTPPPTRWPGASRSCSRSGPTRRSAVATTTTSDEWPVTGMGIARRIAHTTYRHEAELDDRFGRRPRVGEDPLGGGGRYDVESYLDHHAAKLARRFDPNSYVVLTEAMNSHDVGRGRGGLAAALAGYAGALHVAGRDHRPALPAAAVGGDRRSPRGVGAVGHRVAPRPRRLPRRDRAGGRRHRPCAERGLSRCVLR